MSYSFTQQLASLRSSLLHFQPLAKKKVRPSLHLYFCNVLKFFYISSPAHAKNHHPPPDDETDFVPFSATLLRRNTKFHFSFCPYTNAQDKVKGRRLKKQLACFVAGRLSSQPLVLALVASPIYYFFYTTLQVVVVLGRAKTVSEGSQALNTQGGDASVANKNSSSSLKKHLSSQKHR